MADAEEEALKESLKNHPHLTLEELREFKELFNLVDEDKGGSISPHELGSLMETLGLKPNQEELDAMIREIDEDGNGEIDFDEFVQVMSRKVQPTYTPEEVKSAFKVFEAANAGLPQGHVKVRVLGFLCVLGFVLDFCMLWAFVCFGPLCVLRWLWSVSCDICTREGPCNMHKQPTCCVTIRNVA